jgi:Fuc2NAc and GlcNAc transferase
VTAILLATCVGACFLSMALSAVVRKLAVSHGVLDLPNDRSSHSTPIPRGGGVAIVVATSVAAVFLAWYGLVDSRLFIAVTGGGALVAIVGFLDDRHQLPARVRFAAHLAAALWALWWLGGLPPLRLGNEVVSFGWTGYVIGALVIVWTLNLFNFMDGIDGIAASEAVFVAWCGAWLALLAGSAGAVAAMGAVLGAACVGFLWWNWSPAKLFMGDVGSGYLGYVIIVLGIGAARESAVALLVWLVLGGAFFTDATVTLVRRIVRRERVYEAHRTHAYQWLARRWGSHRRVVLLVLLVNCLWLLPCALFAVLRPVYAAVTVAVALVPLVILTVSAGAGRAENQPRKRP